jgi:WhiB family redox-sensing transcriptional regulator
VTDTGQDVTDLTARGLTASDIATRLGISKRTVTRWRAKHLTTVADPSTRWQTQAACATPDADPHWFIPAESGRTSYSRGRAVCIRCPVRDACLTDALTREGNAKADDRAGLWGGLSPEQRANLAAVRRRVVVVRDREAEAQARHRDELVAALKESA